MDPELLRMYKAAARALEAGADSAKVNAHIARITDGRFTNLDALRQAAALDSAAGESEPMQAESGGNRFTRRRSIREGLREAADILRMGAQGATFGFGDEIAGAIAAAIPGGKGYREARDASRENLARIRGEMPEAAFLAEVAGGFAVPGAGTVGAARTGATAGSAIGRAAAAGAASGALYGAGEADELEDVPGDALAGGLLGGFIGGAGTAGVRGVQGGRRFLNDKLRGSAAEVGEEVATRLRSGTGLQAEAAPVRQAAQQRARAVFGELDELREIDSPALRSVLTREDVAKVAGVADDIVQGNRNPGFTDAQKAHQRVRAMRDRAQKLGDMDSFERAAKLEAEIFEALNDATEGRYAEALPEYAREMAAVRAVRDGQRAASKSADEVEAAWQALADNPEAQTAFREGLAARLAQQIEGGGVAAFLRRAETPQMKRKLAVLFDGDTRAMEGFLSEIAEAAPGSRAKVLDALKTWAIRGAGAAVGFQGARSLFDIL